MRKVRRLWLPLLLTVGLLLSCASCENNASPSADGQKRTLEDISSIHNLDVEFTSRELTPVSSNNAVEILFSAEGITCEKNENLTVEGTQVTVSGEGNYCFSGECSDGRIVVAGEKTDKINLIFDGLSLTSASGPALLVETADKVFLTLTEESVNSLADSSAYGEDMLSADYTAALYSKEDFSLTGSGSLSVTGNYDSGIVCKDSLVLAGGSIQVTAAGNGIVGKDCVKLTNADITVEAGKNGVKSSNTEDSERGYIYMADGKLSITSENDALEAVTALVIEGGEVTCKTHGGSETVTLSEGDSAGMFDESWFHFNAWDIGGEETDTSETVSTSYKGLKCDGIILVTDGTISLDTADDAIHAGNSVQIDNGTWAISSGDDAIHADDTLIINGGEIAVAKSYEGLEATEIYITGGDTSVTASDDGLNAAGGTDYSSTGGESQPGYFASDTGLIDISGGYLLVNASGDGVDSNGTLAVSGGIVLVSGPTNDGNGPLDFQTTGTITGGIVCAVGADGMAQNFTEASGVASVFTTFTSQEGGTSLALMSGEEVVLSFTSAKKFECAVMASSAIEVGESYTLVAGGTCSEADENGFATSGTLSGGEILGTLEVTDSVTGTGNEMGGGMGGGKGGMDEKDSAAKEADLTPPSEDNRQWSGGTADSESGSAPELPSGDVPDISSGEMPDMSSGEMPDMSSGEKPSMTGKGGNGSSGDRTSPEKSAS